MRNNLFFIIFCFLSQNSRIFWIGIQSFRELRYFQWLWKINLSEFQSIICWLKNSKDFFGIKIIFHFLLSFGINFEFFWIFSQKLMHWFWFTDRYRDSDNQTPEDSSEPIIDGLKQSYLSTDVLNVTCVSSRYKPVPELKWFINKREIGSRYTTLLKPTLYEEGFGVQHLSLQYSLQNMKPSKTFKSNKYIVSLMCVESLTQELSRGRETLDLTSTAEPMPDNTVGAGNWLLFYVFSIIYNFFGLEFT